MPGGTAGPADAAWTGASAGGCVAVCLLGERSIVTDPLGGGVSFVIVALMGAPVGSLASMGGPVCDCGYEP
ncbi:hypothetical protein K2X14_14165 [Acetobacter sp. TBRC 12305]|uniref:hypothetical protein n=1 Tax=Acetobacter garciniae TaxID=2817435 RepID=UPI001C72D65F|nr:hypothetical protein [Acetobacter garciniae]MBX0345979.1 hypothetical protein [Acetobacter garciniae]